MELDFQATMQEAAARAAERETRILMLAGQVGALTTKNKALEDELTKLKALPRAKKK